MDYKLLDLEKLIRKLGAPNLAYLIGNSRIESIAEITDESITETKLTKFLFLKHGTQILANKELRQELLLRLPPSYQGFILDGKFDQNRRISENDLRSILQFRWSRNSALSLRTISIFGLSDEYLAPSIERPLPSEIIIPALTLHPYQLRLKNRLIRSLVLGDERVLVHMPTGAGKTRTCIEAVADYWRSFADRDGYVVWLAHSEELCEQAVETFKMIWSGRGDSPIEIFRLWGAHETPDFKSNNGFVVASLQRLHAMRTSKTNAAFQAIAELKSKCRLIVIDEAHKCVAPTYKSGIDYISNIEKTKIIGLTATPGRGLDNPETKELVNFFNQNKITLTDEYGNDIDNSIKFLQDHNYLAKVVRRVKASDVTVDLNEAEQRFVSTFLDIPTTVLKKLGQDAQRNALILGEIAALYTECKSTIVFALSVDHAHLITELLNLKNIDARCVDGNCSVYDRQKYIEEYKSGKVKVLVNYGVLTTGFDAPNTNAVLIARPTGSLVLYSQMIGRGIRGPKMGGNEECILVDIKDNLIGFPDEKQAFTYFDDEWKQ